MINKSFENDKSAQTITKNPSGEKVSSGVKEVNAESYALESFGGRTLRHQKSVVPVGGKQVVVGVAGQKWDDIPLSLRSQVVWFESDFEK